MPGMAMSPGDLQQQWFERVWNRGEEHMIDELVDADAIGHGLVDEHGQEVRGVEALKSFYRGFRETFPDIQIEIVQSVSEGEWGSVLCRVKATHLGHAFFGEPTGKPVEFTGQCMARFRNGKIVESWNHFDFQTVAQQLA